MSRAGRSGAEWDALEATRTARSPAQLEQLRRRNRAGGLARAAQRRAHRARRHAPRPRTRQLALMSTPGITYPREAVEADYIAEGGRADGARTLGDVYVQDVATVLYWRERARLPTTTGLRRAKGLAKAGRPRTDRTVRNHRRWLREHGYVRYQPIGRSHIRLEIGRRERPRAVYACQKISTCVPQREQHPLRGASALALHGKTAFDSAGCAGRERSPPAAPAGNGSDEGVRRGAQLALPLAERQRGFAAELEQLVRQLGPDALLRARESEGEP